MQRIFILISAIVLSGCEKAPNACIYSTDSGVHSCFQNTIGNNSDFLPACKQVLTFNRLKYKGMVMNTGDNCPSSPTSTCINVLDNMAELNEYGPASDEEMAIRRRACNTAKGLFTIH